MKHILIISIAILFIFSSCEKKLDIDLPDSEKKIVVNGIVNPDSLMKVRISKSMNVLDNGKIQYLSDATVKLFKDDTLLEELTNLDSGYFQSSVVPKINSDYKLTVDYSDLTSVSASIKLQNPVQIMEIDTVSEMQFYNYGNGFIGTLYVMHFNIKISDNANLTNFYFLSISALTPLYEYDFNSGEYILVGYENNSIGLSSQDPVLSNSEHFILDSKSGIVFSDEMFNGTEYTLNVESYIQKYREFEEQDELGAMYYIELLTVTQDVYNYITSYNLNQYTQYDPFAQPVQILSNVNNGLGLFSGYTMDVDSVYVEF